MGAGVTLFDYDNDGRLDQFLVNGAPISDRIGLWSEADRHVNFDDYSVMPAN